VERDGSSRRRTLKMPNRSKPIDPRARIGHVHLKVADLERALNALAIFSKEAEKLIRESKKN
jgi:hypothetical protein